MNAMAENLRFNDNSCFAKTSAGVSEIQTRALGLNPLLRRLLVLVDGKRSFSELVTYVSGHDLSALLEELLGKGCIEEKEVPKPAKISAAAPASPQAVASAVDSVKSFTEQGLMALAPMESRSAKDVRMARDFMINTVNTMFGQYTRLTLVEAIHACQSTADLRKVYPEWVRAMSESSIGSRRLPELNKQLAQTL